jgi:hypothetical protein
MTGVTRLESAIKKNGLTYFSLIEHFLKIASSREGSEDTAVTVRNEKPSSDIFKIIITHKNYQIGSWDVRLSPAILKAHSIVSQAGLKVTMDFYSNRLTVTAGPERFDIHIRAAGGEQGGDHIRIYSNLKSTDLKKNTDSILVLKSMLSFNGLDSTYGKFAISEPGASFI